MNAHDYSAWSELSGLYLKNVSHADRYRTFADQLSPAGVTTVIVHDFLSYHKSSIDVMAWRTFEVYEMGADQKWRVTMTVQALESIGATRVATAVRRSKKQSPFDMFQQLASADLAGFREAMKTYQGEDLMNHMRERIAAASPETAEGSGQPAGTSSVTEPSPEYESREQIELLLEQYVEKNNAVLQADIDRHGDPRLVSGFTVEGRMQELEDQRRRQITISIQREQIGKFHESMKEIEQASAKAEHGDRRSAAWLPALRRAFLELISDNQRWQSDDLLPETAAIREKVQSFMTNHPGVFALDYIGDADLTARAKAIGAFTGDIEDQETTIYWGSPQGLTCDWTTFSLMAVYPENQNQYFEALLGVAERLQLRWSTVNREWQQEVIACFRENYLHQMDDWELEDYERDASGQPTDASILAHVEGASITLSVEADEEEQYSCYSTHFGVEWDGEHGFELEWDDENEGDEAA